MNRLKQTGLAALMILSCTSTAAVAAEKAVAKGEAVINGNITATSTYVWRGVAKSADAAMQGGINYTTPDGVHAGIWTSNVFGGSELDITIGYAGATKGINYDAGLIIYTFPQYEALAGPNEKFNFNELYASISKDMLNARVSLSSDAGNYIEVNANFEKFAAGWDLGLHFGSYNVDEDYGVSGITYSGLDEDYNDYNVSLGTSMDGFDVSFVLSDTNLDDDSYRTIISVSKTFKP